MAELDAILFDAGGVLVVPRPDVTGPTLAPFGGRTDEATLIRAHFVGAHALDHSPGGGEDWDAYILGYVRGAGVPAARRAQAAAAIKAVLDHWLWCHPIPGARETLLALGARGVRIGVVSNAGGQIQGELARVGLGQVGDGPGARLACVVDSHVVGVSKPDPAIFVTAVEALGLQPSPRIGYVGDLVCKDVRSAADAGLTPFLHDPYGLHDAEPTPSGPHRSLARLSQLLELV
jgi:putative hydrolase of the HAD superfamily